MVINVRGIANGRVQGVNPDTKATIYKSIGFDVVRGKQVPKYEKQEAFIQVQQLTQKDIMFLSNTELQENAISVYLQGHYDGANRIDGTTPDIFVFDDKEWKVVHVPERWSTWSRIILCQQRKSITE